MDRYKETNIATIISIVGNIFLLFIKFVIGFITNSQAMISDAFNSAGDIFSSIMAFIGNKIASKEADEDHNLGHGKAEYIFSLLISVSMILVSLELCITSIKSIFNYSNYNFSIWLIIICIATILVKMTLYFVVNRAYKKYNNILLLSTAMDHKNDCFLTSLNLIACICSYLGYKEVDGVVGTLISLWILRTGIIIFKSSFDTLMDKSMNNETREKILNIVKEYPEIKRIDHFNSTPVGYQYQISLTIYVNGEMTTYDSHEIANKLEKEITKLDEIYLAIIHVNPIPNKVKDKN
jgi:cation diffusion facilitator family transporter